jgi:hypothetical protein
MNYLISEKQYKLILENEQDNILTLNLESFDYNWNIIVNFLKKRGYPKWKTYQSLLLTDENITSLHNLVEVNHLDIYYTNIKDLGFLKKVNSLSFDPDLIENIGNLTEVNKFNSFLSYKKAVELGFNSGSFGGETIKIGFSQFEDLVYLSRESDLSVEDLHSFFKDGSLIFDNLYNDTRDIVDLIINHYLTSENENIIKAYQEYNSSLNLTDNILNIPDVIEVILDSYFLCKEEIATKYMIDKIKESLSSIVDIISYGYDNNNELYFEVYFDYDYIIKHFLNSDIIEDNWYSILYDSVINSFSSGEVNFKSKLKIDKLFELEPSRQCINKKINYFL